MTWNQSLIDGPVPIAIYGDPVTDDEGNTYRPVTGYVEGYHLNIAPQIMRPDLEIYRSTPRNPRRIFAGAETIFLRFVDEAEATEKLSDYWSDPQEPDEEDVAT
jgi:hypothetical protein